MNGRMTKKKKEKKHVHFIKISYKEFIQNPLKNKSKNEDILMSPYKLVVVFIEIKISRMRS